MEYCDGGTLKSMCKASLPGEEVIAYISKEVIEYLASVFALLKVMIQVLQALAYLHERRQIHRDLKVSGLD